MKIQFTRGRPYKKDDNAHIEQKNWTHVRKLVGYLRYDTPLAVAALNALYRHELRLFQNLFLPSVTLVRKERVGARLRRRYDTPRTPLDRLLACPAADPATIASWSRSGISSIPSPCPRRSTERSSAWWRWPPSLGLGPHRHRREPRPPASASSGSAARRRPAISRHPSTTATGYAGPWAGRPG